MSGGTPLALPGRLGYRWDLRGTPMRALPVWNILLLSSLIAGCGDHAAHEATDHAAHVTPAAEPAAHTAGQEGHHGAARGLALTLDAGQPWAMDEHTRGALGRIEARLAQGPSSDDVAGLQALGGDLDTELQALIQGCTMEGPSHDQLHVWLAAVLPAVSALRSGTDVVALRAERDKLSGFVKEARVYFR